MEASRTQYACANPEKSEKTKQILQIIQIEEDDKINPNKVKARPAPDFVSNLNCAFENLGVILQGIQQITDTFILPLETGIFVQSLSCIF